MATCKDCFGEEVADHYTWPNAVSPSLAQPRTVSLDHRVFTCVYAFQGYLLVRNRDILWPSAKVLRVDYKGYHW